MRVPSALLAAFGATAVTAASLGELPRLVPPPLEDESFTLSKRATGTGVFQQLLDHSNPALGSFQQRFWWSDEFYAGPGSPIVFFNPGEVPAAAYTGYLTNRTITGMFARAIGGAVVMLEHRYWGDSIPFTEFSPVNLQYLNLNNSITDSVYFANNVQLPFDVNGTTKPSQAPWIFSGGSYSGALSAWTRQNAPGTFWAYHASSAAQNAIRNFWEYFHPMQQGMPQNCSSDVAKVIDYVDSILKHGSAEKKQALKNKFGLGGVVHDSDFAVALQNAPWQWQATDFTTGYSEFYRFCDYVENMFPNVTTPAPGPEGVGLCKAVNGYARWTREILVPDNVCGVGSNCFDSYDENSSDYTNWDHSNSYRPWFWLLCNEPLEFWQVGAPEGTPSIVSRFSDATYWQRQCPLYFPPSNGYTYGSGRGITPDDVNAAFGGWNIVNTTRLIYVNGEFDPWRESTVSSSFRPGGPLQSTEQVPVKLVPGGIHCPDLLARNGAANAGLAKIQAEVVDIVAGWAAEFYTERGIKRDFKI